MILDSLPDLTPKSSTHNRKRKRKSHFIPAKNHVFEKKVSEILERVQSKRGKVILQWSSWNSDKL